MTSTSDAEAAPTPTTADTFANDLADPMDAHTDKAPIYRFVLTGGPCGGKTTALARVFSFLRERGFEVMTCPEAFALLVQNGMSFSYFAVPGMDRHMQGAVLDTQMALEDSTFKVLQARGKPSVILSDRGSMDGSVYIRDEDFAHILRERGLDKVTLRDNRYDAVFHLVTAADGAEAFYTLANNEVRTEPPEQAREVDRKTQRAWVGHPHLYVIDNTHTETFEAKMNRLINRISKIVGLPSNLKRRSAKFLLEPTPAHGSQDNLTARFPREIEYQVFDVEKVYLRQAEERTAQGDYSFIRRRSHVDGGGQTVGSVYQLTTVKHAADEVIEQKRIISEREYQTAYQSRDTSRHVVQQRRISFLYQKQSFTIHVYQQPVRDLMLLHAQVEVRHDDAVEVVDLPPFLAVARRVTHSPEDEQAYGAYSISLVDKA